MIMVKCKHCGRSFDSRLVDIKHHEENCKEHLAEVVERNIERILKGKPPTRTGR